MNLPPVEPGTNPPKSAPINITSPRHLFKPLCSICENEITDVFVSLNVTKQKQAHFECYAKWRGREVHKMETIPEED